MRGNSMKNNVRPPSFVVMTSLVTFERNARKLFFLAPTFTFKSYRRSHYIKRLPWTRRREKEDDNVKIMQWLLLLFMLGTKGKETLFWVLQLITRIWDGQQLLKFVYLPTLHCWACKQLSHGRSD